MSAGSILQMRFDVSESVRTFLLPGPRARAAWDVDHSQAYTAVRAPMHRANAPRALTTRSVDTVDASHRVSTRAISINVAGAAQGVVGDERHLTITTIFRGLRE